MTNQASDNYQSPIEIELLFNNKKLELFQYLIIIYSCLKDYRKRKISPEQLLYFYTIIFYEADCTKMPLIFKYTKDKSKLNMNLIALSSIDYIEVTGSLTSSINSIKLNMTKKGIEFIESIESVKIQKYISQMRTIIKRHPYESSLMWFNKILYEGAESIEN